MGIIVADSEFNLTLFAQEQAWLNDVDLGEGVQSLWTGTACAATVPGRVFGLPLERCTKDQFLEEIKTQLYDCGGLDQLIQAANGGRSLKSFPVMRWEVWHEWKFSSDGICSPAPKWVNTTKTQTYQPTAATPVPNLHLAGAHTQTAADVWSIEAAAESGRRAAQRIDSSISIIPQYRPYWLRLLQRLDDVCYAVGAPHVVDVMIVLLVIVVVGLIVWSVL
jgi:hypothetical protein